MEPVLDEAEAGFERGRAVAEGPLDRVPEGHVRVHQRDDADLHPALAGGLAVPAPEEQAEIQARNHDVGKHFDGFECELPLEILVHLYVPDDHMRMRGVGCRCGPRAVGARLGGGRDGFRCFGCGRGRLGVQAIQLLFEPVRPYVEMEIAVLPRSPGKANVRQATQPKHHREQHPDDAPVNQERKGAAAESGEFDAVELLQPDGFAGGKLLHAWIVKAADIIRAFCFGRDPAGGLHG